MQGRILHSGLYFTRLYLTLSVFESVVESLHVHVLSSDFLHMPEPESGSCGEHEVTSSIFNPPGWDA